eukprot:4112285-Prymnesium_polylepis.2
MTAPKEHGVRGSANKPPRVARHTLWHCTDDGALDPGGRKLPVEHKESGFLLLWMVPHVHQQLATRERDGCHIAPRGKWIALIRCCGRRQVVELFPLRVPINKWTSACPHGALLVAPLHLATENNDGSARRPEHCRVACTLGRPLPIIRCRPVGPADAVKANQLRVAGARVVHDEVHMRKGEDVRLIHRLDTKVVSTVQEERVTRTVQTGLAEHCQRVVEARRRASGRLGAPVRLNFEPAPSRATVGCPERSKHPRLVVSNTRARPTEDNEPIVASVVLQDAATAASIGRERPSGGLL